MNSFDWNKAKSFLVTAEMGSLTAASKRLKISQPTLSRQVSAFEQELGVTLFERRGRGLELTQAGLSILDNARIMNDAADNLELVATGQSKNIEGLVTISVTEVMATYMMPDIIRALRVALPYITLDLVATDDSSDLKKREADIAIRGFRPTQPDLISKRLMTIAATFYATPEYLSSLPHTNGRVDFSQSQFIGMEGQAKIITWLTSQGIEVTNDNFSVRSDSRVVQWEMTKQGIGIGLMPTQIGDSEPLVSPILTTLPPLEADLWLVSHSELRTNERIKRVFDFLSDYCQSNF